jgi:hypothetical protein
MDTLMGMRGRSSRVDSDASDCRASSPSPVRYSWSELHSGIENETEKPLEAFPYSAYDGYVLGCWLPMEGSPSENDSSFSDVVARSVSSCSTRTSTPRGQAPGTWDPPAMNTCVPVAVPVMLPCPPPPMTPWPQFGSGRLQTKNVTNQIQTGVSVGSMGHPHCNGACKYNSKAKGCKDGEQCDHCHICVWKNTKRNGYRGY